MHLQLPQLGYEEDNPVPVIHQAIWPRLLDVGMRKIPGKVWALAVVSLTHSLARRQPR